MAEKEFDLKFAAMLTGDKAAFTDVYNEIKKPVFTVIYRVVSDRDKAEDVMQDLFLRLLRHGVNSPVKNPRAYIFQMAHNMALDEVKKKESEELSDEMTDGTDVFDISCVGLDIESALARLPLPERETVSLHLTAGLKFREIAKMKRVPLGTVLSRYNSAIKKLRRML